MTVVKLAGMRILVGWRSMRELLFLEKANGRANDGGEGNVNIYVFFFLLLIFVWNGNACKRTNGNGNGLVVLFVCGICGQPCYS
jgi:hypothetical protein